MNTWNLARIPCDCVGISLCVNKKGQAGKVVALVNPKHLREDSHQPFKGLSSSAVIQGPLLLSSTAFHETLPAY